MLANQSFGSVRRSGSGKNRSHARTLAQESVDSRSGVPCPWWRRSSCKTEEEPSVCASDSNTGKCSTSACASNFFALICGVKKRSHRHKYQITQTSKLHLSKLTTWAGSWVWNVGERKQRDWGNTLYLHTINPLFGGKIDLLKPPGRAKLSVLLRTRSINHHKPRDRRIYRRWQGRE